MSTTEELNLTDAAREPAVPDAAPPSDDLRETVIRRRSGWVGLNWSELVEFRELLFFLIWRDVKVRYKQTALGAAWALLQPLMTMAIFTVVFGRLAKLPSQGLPYPVFVFAGLLPWMFFSNGVSAASLSLVNQQSLLTKVYFPRLFVPTSSIGAFLVDMTISFGLYGLILAYYRVVPSWQVVYLPGLILLTVLATLGLSYALAALIVLYRDVRHVVPFLLQALMYVSPLIYPSSMMPAWIRGWLALNPMYGLVEAYRSSILGTPWDLPALATSVASSLALFAFGVLYYRRSERSFADLA